MPHKLGARAHKIKDRKELLLIYGSILLLIFHSYIVAYVNSSYIERFTSTDAVGLIYTVGSALTVFIFLFVSYILRKVGNYYSTLIFLSLNFFVVMGMGFADSYKTAVPLLIAHLTLIPLIIFNLDIFLEEHIGDKESSTGSKRGLILALSSLVAASTPLLTGTVIDTDSNLAPAYMVSALAVIPLFILVLIGFRHFKDPKYKHIKFLQALRSFWIKKNIRYVLISHLLMQVFFFFMVVYTPLYLSLEIGFNWWEIGLIVFGAQLAYVFFEYPIGILADKFWGETEMMAIGFLIIIISNAYLAFISTANLALWIIAMFITRVGASLVEVTTESYFFKHTKSNDAEIISFFRITRPLSNVFGALSGGLIMLFLPFNLIFIASSLILLPGAILATKLKDTK